MKKLLYLFLVMVSCSLSAMESSTFWQFFTDNKATYQGLSDESIKKLLLAYFDNYPEERIRFNGISVRKIKDGLHFVCPSESINTTYIIILYSDVNRKPFGKEETKKNLSSEARPEMKELSLDKIQMLTTNIFDGIREVLKSSK